MSDKVIKYGIIGGIDSKINDFLRKINNAINMGWELYGNTLVCKDSFYQPMVLKSNGENESSLEDIINGIMEEENV